MCVHYPCGLVTPPPQHPPLPDPQVVFACLHVFSAGWNQRSRPSVLGDAGNTAGLSELRRRRFPVFWGVFRLLPLKRRLPRVPGDPTSVSDKPPGSWRRRSGAAAAVLDTPHAGTSHVTVALPDLRVHLSYSFCTLWWVFLGVFLKFRGFTFLFRRSFFIRFPERFFPDGITSSGDAERTVLYFKGPEEARDGTML